MAVRHSIETPLDWLVIGGCLCSRLDRHQFIVRIDRDAISQWKTRELSHSRGNGRLGRGTDRRRSAGCFVESNAMKFEFHSKKHREFDCNPCQK